MWTSTQLDLSFSAQFVTTCSSIFHSWNFIYNGRIPANLSELYSRCYILVLREAELTAICDKIVAMVLCASWIWKGTIFLFSVIIATDPRIFCRNFQAASAGSITCQLTGWISCLNFGGFAHLEPLNLVRSGCLSTAGNIQALLPTVYLQMFVCRGGDGEGQTKWDPTVQT